MVVDLTPEQEDVFRKAAKDEGISLGELVTETVHYVISQRQEETLLLSRLADAEQGDFLTRDQMSQRLQSMFEH